MSPQALDWVEAVLQDLLWCAPPPGVTWTANSREPPIRVCLRRAEEDFADLVMGGPDVVSAAIEFAVGAQQCLQGEAAAALPPCPAHGEALVPRRMHAGAEWRCPEGDVSCPVGKYTETLWPPPAGTAPEPRLVADRLRRRSLAFLSLVVEAGDGRPLVRVRLTEGADQAGFARAVDPLNLEVTGWVPPPKTVRTDSDVGEGGPPYRALTYLGGFGQLARLAGRLHGPAPGGDADVVVEVANGTLVPVRLLPDHRVGEPGGALLLDAQGRPFARVGDNVVCAGGARHTAVLNKEAVFVAWEIRAVAKEGASGSDP